MNSQNLYSAILTFLNQKFANGALLIDGEWGSGKTYYVKNELIPNLLNKEKFNYVYLSLFGISSSVELKNAIIVKSLIDAETNSSLGGTIKDRITKIISKKNFLSSFISSFEVSDLVDFEKIVFIFDDIERVHNKQLLLEFMGIITSSLIEENNYKVILVGNLKKIENEDFFVYQEKVISRILKYKTDIELAVDGILSKIKIEDEQVYNRIAEKKSFIVAIIKNYYISNFRSISQSIGFLYTILKNNELEDLSQILDEIIYFIITINTEFRNSNIGNDFWKDIKHIGIDDWPFSDRKYVYINWEKSNQEKLSIDTIKDRIKEYYQYDLSHFEPNSSGKSIFFQSLFEFIIEGVFHNKKLLSEIKYLVKIKSDKLANKKQEIIDHLSNWENIKYDIFKESKIEVLKMLNNDKLPIISFISIVRAIYQIRNKAPELISDFDSSTLISAYKRQTYIETLKKEKREFIDSLSQRTSLLPNELAEIISHDIILIQEEHKFKESLALIEDISYLFNSDHYYDKVSKFLSNCNADLASNKIWNYITSDDYYFTNFIKILDYLINIASIQNKNGLSRENIEKIIFQIKLKDDINKLSPLDLFRYNEIIKRLDKIVSLYNAFEVISEGNS